MPLHIHVPKPLHGWRAMFNEILVIAIGILLALVLNQGVEWAHWKQKVAEGETQLSEDALATVALCAQYFAVSPCVHSQLNLVRPHLLQNAGKRANLPNHGCSGRPLRGDLSAAALGRWAWPPSSTNRGTRKTSDQVFRGRQLEQKNIG